MREIDVLLLQRLVTLEQKILQRQRNVILCKGAFALYSPQFVADLFCDLFSRQ